MGKFHKPNGHFFKPVVDEAVVAEVITEQPAAKSIGGKVLDILSRNRKTVIGMGIGTTVAFGIMFLYNRIKGCKKANCEENNEEK